MLIASNISEYSLKVRVLDTRGARLGPSRRVLSVLGGTHWESDCLDFAGLHINLQGVSPVAHPLLPRTQPERLQPAGLHPGEAWHLRGRDKAGDRLGDEDSAAEAVPGPGVTEGTAIAMMMSVLSSQYSQCYFMLTRLKAPSRVLLF